MGYNHVTTGAIVGLLTLPDGGVAYQVGWVAAVAGAALLPDLDSPSASASRMWGPVTEGLSRVISPVTGGHRWGTHDLVLAPVCFGALVLVAAMHPLSQWLVLSMIIGLALKGLSLTGVGRVPVGVNMLVSGVGAWWLQSTGASGLGWELAIAIALGVAVHILGDALTPEGIPIPVLWLAGFRSRPALPLFKTGKLLERTLVAPALSLVALYLLSQAVDLEEVMHEVQAMSLPLTGTATATPTGTLSSTVIPVALGLVEKVASTKGLTA